ncbi:hypothetical protein GLOTRDRAFT_117324 [Gloeophyllum trabeum ATCC 11539]|uniref:Uncharacterized protein n=1 Tax=Gloeophyllum trabeum (strain ATCC 11539 / FP-39264 / Madison 617) TaxID=670483 RepID=S7Q0T4_GLOTA|nr:uncharacterized protein GLOTRDRAFT_117324 [Gloeophyllum trabeum ATCC 11539]EPQ53378.1 hypothetical protein GLOTRDRAFT_117324 [Gloeophyllum trabeum ATCC 11539]
MHFRTLLPALLLAALSPALANPFVTRQDTCECQSPTGCPGYCQDTEGIGAACFNNCGNGIAIACGACQGKTGACFVDATGDECWLMYP